MTVTIEADILCELQEYAADWRAEHEYRRRYPMYTEEMEQLDAAIAAARAVLAEAESVTAETH